MAGHEDLGMVDRGAEGDARYWKAMDASMPEKLAVCEAHFRLTPGARVADMGCGSGLGAYLLAKRNPGVSVIGVDISEEAVRHAKAAHRLPNLSFLHADAREPLFAGEPLDGIFSGSAGHHFHSFAGYDRGAVRRAFANHLSSLREGGTLVIRDFVSPGRDTVLLELPDEASRGDTPELLSDADLLVRFAATARPRCAAPGFLLTEETPVAAGRRLFRLQHHWAAEFLLRKDYRTSWDAELEEEYGYFTAAEFRAEIERLGALVTSAAERWNPWIIKNRLDGKARLLDERRQPIGWPATNFVLVAERRA